MRMPRDPAANLPYSRATISPWSQRCSAPSARGAQVKGDVAYTAWRASTLIRAGDLTASLVIVVRHSFALGKASEWTCWRWS